MDDSYDLNLDTTGYQQSIQAAMGTTNQFQAALSGLTSGSVQAGRAVGLMTLPVRLLERGFGGFATQAAAVETQLGQLRATSSVTGQSVEKLAKSADVLARTFPIGNAGAVQLVTQLQALGVSGASSEAKIGALGKTMIQLAAATGSSSPQIAQSMSSVSRAFGDTNLNPARIRKFGDSLTTLTAKFGGTATGVLEFTKNIAPFARQAGIGESATLGIAGAFSKLGDDGASAATAVNKILGDINKSVRDGGPQIATYANIVGKTADQFRSLAKANPAEALSQVVDALGQGAEGQRGLERLGLDGVRTQRALASLSQGGELRNAIQTSVSSYGNNSTSKASDEALKGFNNSLSMLQASGEQAAAALGTPLLASLTQFSHALQGPINLFNDIVKSPIGGGLRSALFYASMAKLGTTAFNAAGNASAGLGLLGSNSVARGFTAGRLLQKSGGDNDLGWETAYNHGNKRQQRALDALMQMRVQAEIDEKTGTKTGGMIKAGMTSAEYALQRPGAVDRAIKERRDEIYETQRARHGADIADEMRADREAQDRRYDKRPIMRSFMYVARPMSQVSSLYGYAQSQLQRTYNEDDNIKRSNVDRPVGRYAMPWKDFVGAFKGETGSDGETAKVTERLANMRRVIGEVQHTIGQIGTGTVVKDTASAWTRPLLESSRSIDKFGASIGKTAMSMGASFFGGPVGVAVAGGVAGFGLASSTIARGRNMQTADVSRIQNLSTTDVIDSYRDSIGKATANTITLGDQMDKIAKSMDQASNNILAGSRLTTDELALASSSRRKVINRYRGSDSQIAAEIGGLSINGTTSAEQSAIRIDLARQVSASRANKILGQVDWSGLGMTGSRGTGTLSSSYIDQRVAQTKDTYNKVGDSRSLFEKLGTDAFAEPSGKQFLWGNNAHLREGTKKQIDEVLSSSGQVYDQQKINYGDAYASQERMQTANKIIASARKQHVSNDQLQYTEQALAIQLGVDPSKAGKFQYNSKQYGANTQFTDLLYKNSKDYRTKVDDLGLQDSQVRGGLTPLSQQSPLAQAAARVGGAYGRMFDNTKPGGVTGPITASLSQPTDMNLLDKAITAIVQGGQKAGLSLNQVADNASKFSQQLGGDLTSSAVQMQNAVRERALQVQSYGSAFRAPGQNIALSLQQHMADQANTGTDETSVQRRQAAGPALAQDAAALRDMYAQRIQQNQGYLIQVKRSTYDFNLSMANQQTDYNTSVLRGEEDLGVGRFRANRNYNLQVQRSEEDFSKARLRQQRDFGIQMKRGAQDAAQGMYSAYHRIATQPIWDAQSLQENLAEQATALKQQNRDLARIRKQGINEQTINQLGLTKTDNAQELSQLVSDLGNDKGMAGRLNATVGSKVGAAGALYNDKGNTEVQRAKEDFKKGLADQAIDFRTAAKRTRHDFDVSMADQYSDYLKSQRRAEHDFRQSQDRENTQFKTSMTRMHEDLIQSQKVITGDLASLQALANKGLNAGEKDFTKVMGDGLNTAMAALKKFAPGYLQIIQNLLNGIQTFAAASGGLSQWSGTGGQGQPGAAGAGTRNTLGSFSGGHIPTKGQNVSTPGGFDAAAIAAHGDTRSLLYDLAGMSGAHVQVTSVDTGKHAKGSLHYQKEAVDFGGSVAEMDKLAAYLFGLDLAGKIHATELIFENPDSGYQYALKNGKSVDGNLVFGAATMKEHRNHVHFGLNATDAKYIEDHFSGVAGLSGGSNQTKKNQRTFASGGVLMNATEWRPGKIGGEAGNEAIIPLNASGVAVIAAAMSKYMSSADHKSMTTSGSRTHIVFDYSHHSYDYSTKVLGEVKVMSNDPNEMGHKLAAKQRSNNLTATPTRRHS